MNDKLDCMMINLKTMKETVIIKAIILAIVISLIAVQAGALDYPHFGINNIDCDSCHFVYGTQPSLLPPWTVHTPQDIDDTPYNTLCWSCQLYTLYAYILTS